MYSKGIGKGPPSDDSDSDCYSDHSSLWEKDSSSSSVSSVESSCYNVSKFEAHLYYFGIRGRRRRGPKLIFRTSKDVRLVTRPSVGPDKFFDRRTGKAEFKIGVFDPFHWVFSEEKERKERKRKRLLKIMYISFPPLFSIYVSVIK